MVYLSADSHPSELWPNMELKQQVLNHKSDTLPFARISGSSSSHWLKLFIHAVYTCQPYPLG